MHAGASFRKCLKRKTSEERRKDCRWLSENPTNGPGHSWKVQPASSWLHLLIAMEIRLAIFNRASDIPDPRAQCTAGVHLRQAGPNWRSTALTQIWTMNKALHIQILSGSMETQGQKPCVEVLPRLTQSVSRTKRGHITPTITMTNDFKLFITIRIPGTSRPTYLHRQGYG